MAQINFAKNKKKYLNVTLPDETVIMVSTPKKKTLNQLVTIRENLKELDVDDIDESVVDDLYEVSAIIMSNNKTGTVITKEKLEDLLDMEDIFKFYMCYMDFLKALTDEKN